MTTISYYVSEADVRRHLGLASTNIADADVLEFIKLAQDEVDKITNTTYLVVQDSGTASSATSSSLTDSTKSWAADEWNADANLVGGYMIHIYTGTGSGQTRTIIDNTTTALTISPNWATTPDATSKYRIFKNTYVNETFDGDGTDVYFTNFYPLLSVYSLTIDSDSVTVGGTSVYQYNQYGKLTLGRSAEVSTYNASYPQLCNVKYYYGVYPIPYIVKEFTAVIAALMIVGYMTGNTFNSAIQYTVPEFSIQKPNATDAFNSVAQQLINQRDFLLTNVRALIRPAFG